MDTVNDDKASKSDARARVLHNYPEWARIEVNTVEGTHITAEITARRLNGTSDTQSGTFDSLLVILSQNFR